MSFGANLQFMRRMHNGITQEELAEKMGVSRQTVSKWEMDCAYPEMEKALALSRLFNCTLDELLTGDLNSGSNAYRNIRVEQVAGFRYVRYAVVSAMPEDDAKTHQLNWAKQVGLAQPELIGWDFPAVSQEQVNVFHMHGYCAACVLPDAVDPEGVEVITQPAARYAAITIENPFSNPFALIPNAYKTLLRYMEVNGLKAISGPAGGVIECFEKEYTAAGVACMDVYIALKP
ncbi:MAG: helix-turn-helix domain-containing protein [Gemmiger sp.]|nr:helix-turn-helix domain-containing protein [Gemmiger sp.]